MVLVSQKSVQMVRHGGNGIVSGGIFPECAGSRESDEAVLSGCGGHFPDQGNTPRAERGSLLRDRKFHFTLYDSRATISPFILPYREEKKL